ncbi:unnamed protein product [Polarella glacialis]|uniref:PNPLA domain-containing protein n=1 Tax=Polarella glacialis TaxID=89957 RepID=A0A813F6Q4_POLGL|nr:unnamed protein product [Polarella glacialis]
MHSGDAQAASYNRVFSEQPAVSNADEPLSSQDEDSDSSSNSEDVNSCCKGLRRRSATSKSTWIRLQEVLSHEEECRRQRRKRWKAELGVESSASLGLCFSGGGVRSADICLGGLWRLAEEGLLPEVSHVSAVSGGAFASAAFATDLLGCWREAPPERGRAAVNSWYRKAARRTILRFQENANYPLQPVRCIQRIRWKSMRRLIGVASLCSLFVFMLLGHPLSFIVWFLMPTLVFFRQIWGWRMQFNLCAPPFRCLNSNCTEFEERFAGASDRVSSLPVNWQHWQTEPFLWAAVGLCSTIGVLRLIGLLHAPLRFEERSSTAAGAKRRKLRLAVLHTLYGVDMLLKRLFVFTILQAFIAMLALKAQIENSGDVGSIWSMLQPGTDNSPLHRTGWELGFNTSQREFVTGLGHGTHDESVIKFESWYTCYNWTMNHWASRELLSVVGTQPGAVPVVVRGGSQHHECGHDFLEGIAGGGEHATGPEADSWFSPDFGAFYWGGIAGEPGKTWAGQGAASPETASFYQDWFSACRASNQGMCFKKADSESSNQLVTGCCESNFTGLVLTGAAVFLALGAFAFLMFESKLVVSIFALLTVPFALAYLVSGIVQWRIFGVVSAAPSATKQGQHLLGHLFRYSQDTWRWLFQGTMILACILMPVNDFIHRGAHLYNKSCLVNSFFHKGQDILLSDCSEVVCPDLIFGCTIMMYKTDFHRETLHDRFSLGSRHLGCAHTHYVATPRSFHVARAMACSAAAMDTFLLTQGDHWSIRFLVLMFNLAQGDWLRVEPLRTLRLNLPLCLAKGNWLRFDRCQRWLDALPITVLLLAIYALLVASESLSQEGSCLPANGVFLAALIAVILVLASTFFMPLCRCLMMFLQPSSLVRSMQMMLLATPVTNMEPPPYLYLGDGGILENSGCLELLLRQTRYILVMENGDDAAFELLTLKRLLHYATEQKVCSFFCPGDPRQSVAEAMEEFQRDDTRTFLHLRILYGWGDSKNNDNNNDNTNNNNNNNSNNSTGGTSSRQEGDLFWVQNRPAGPKGWMAGPQWGPFVPPEEAKEAASPLSEVMNSSSECVLPSAPPLFVVTSPKKNNSKKKKKTQNNNNKRPATRAQRSA